MKANPLHLNAGSRRKVPQMSIDKLSRITLDFSSAFSITPARSPPGIFGLDIRNLNISPFRILQSTGLTPGQEYLITTNIAIYLYKYKIPDDDACK